MWLCWIDANANDDDDDDDNDNDRYVEVVEELKLWERQYDLLSASVLEKFPEIFPEGCCSFEEYKWARHMIESRAWHLRGKQHLAPMADFFNHEPLPSMTYDTEPDEVCPSSWSSSSMVLVVVVCVVAKKRCSRHSVCLVHGW